MQILAKRLFSAKAPWVFKQQNPLVASKSIASAQLENELLSQLSEGYLYAFDSVCDSFTTQDLSSLDQCCEQGLFKSISSLFSSLSSSGYSFSRISSEAPRLTLSNLQLTLGVNITRSSNLRKNDYMMVKSLEELKGSIPLSQIKSQVEKEGLSVSDNILNSCMDYAWVYILPRAPANLVLAVDVIYQGAAPLTLLKDGKDAIYEEKMNEFHVFRFESEAVNMGTQREVMSQGKFDSIFQEIKQEKNKFLSHPWIITDIDNILKGNPYAT